MDNLETYPIDPEVLRALGNEFGKVDKWFARGQTHAPDPEPNSPLAGDDALLTPFLLSDAAVSALGVAVDNFHALRMQITNGHLVHPWAPFTLLRAALENAATAVWLLAPTERDTRVMRRLRLRWVDVLNMLKAGDLIGHPAGAKTREQHIARQQDLARACGFAQDKIALVASNAIGYQTIVKEAAADAPTSFGPAIEPTWMVCSGIAHGQKWATVSLLDRTEVDASVEVEGVRSFRVSAPDKGILAITQTANAMIGYGWYLFDKRRKNPVPDA